MNRETLIIGILIIIIIILLITSFYNFSYDSTQNQHNTQSDQNLSSSAPITNNPSTNENKFVLYYSPHCGACTRFKQIWYDFKNPEKNKKIKDLHVNIMDIDCSENTPDASCGAISKYPTMLLLKKDNTILEYEGERSINALNEFIEKNTK